MKSISIIILFASGFLQGFSQIPDTVVYNHNQNSPSDIHKFSFIQLTDVHIGEGDADGDFGTPGYNDTLTGTDTGYAVTSLRSTVNWINQNFDSHKIKFVIVSGDLTDSGERSEFLKGKEILDSLLVPYIPMIGNHDVWPYTDTTESPVPDGDSLVAGIFGPRFDSLQFFFNDWDDGTRLIPTYNPEANCTSRFQNFSFVYENYLFLLADFETRVHADLGEPGVGPEADLTDFAGGSFNWFKQKLLSYPDKGDKNIFIVSHHPLTKDALGIAGGSFSYGEYDQVTQFLDTLRPHIAAWFAGHLHRASVYGISKWIPDGTITTGIETDSNKEFPNGHFRIVNVYEPALSTEENKHPGISVFPNPTSGILGISTTNSNKNPEQIEIYDLLGKMVFQSKFPGINHPLDISKLNNGVYFLRIYPLDLFCKIIVSKT